MEHSTPSGLGSAIEMAAALVSGELAEPELGLLTDHSVLDLVRATDTVVSILEAARAEALREAVRREAAENEAHCTPAEYLHRGLGHTIRRCRGLVKDAVRQGRYSHLTAAQAAGEVTGEQGPVIGHALSQLPDDLGTDVLHRCEASLVGLAATLDPGELIQAGWRVLEHEAPDRADEILADRLAREEQRACKNRGLSVSDDGHGTTHIKGQLPTSDGAELAAVLNAHAESSWKQQIDDQTTEMAPRDKKLLLADALMALVRAHETHREAPTHGGDRPRVTVLFRLDDLITGLGEMTLSTGHPITACEARRLACDCDIIPAVLDAHGIPLDVGRQERLVNPHLRAALVIRDRGCVFPGCDRAPVECEAHHIQPWWAAGPTTLDNLVLLCPRHHRTCEPGRQNRWDDDDPDRWHIRLGPNRLPIITPPRGYDPDRQPIRHNRFGILRQ